MLFKRLCLFLFFFLSPSLYAHVAVCDHGLQTRESVDLKLQKPRGFATMTPLFSKSKARPKLESTLEQRILIISALPKEQDPGLQAALKFLGHMGVAHDFVELTDGLGERVSPLPDLIVEDQVGRYSGIVLTEFNLSYFDSHQKKYLSALKPEEWLRLNQYIVENHIRTVSLLTYPQAYVGVEEVVSGGVDRDDKISLVPKVLSKYAPDLKREASLSLEKVWHYPVKLKENTQTQGLIQSSHAFDQFLASLHRAQDGREQMHFFFPQHPQSIASAWIAPLWIKWITHNHHQGQRQSFLNIQVDDLFIPTHLWSKEQLNSDGEVYRLDPMDVESYLNFQDYYLRPNTQRKDFRIEMAFNGKGLEDYGGLFVDQLGLNFKKNLEHFTWLTHTYHHFELDHVSYETAVQEVSLNREVELSLNKRYQSVFSQSGIVTPRISGLKNPEVLKALYHTGKKFVVGDNTVEDLRPAKEHLARKTQLNLHGHDGLMIIPRHPNDLFYNVSLPDELHSLFNHLYFPHAQDEFSFEQIMDKNTDEVLARMLSYDAASNMFHQANMRHFDYQGRWTSLMSEWMRGAIEKFRALSTLPILTLDMDRLSHRYLLRDKFERCQVKMTLTKKKGVITQLKLSSKEDCTVPLSLDRPAHLIDASAYDFEKYGPDFIYHLYLSADEEQIILL